MFDKVAESSLFAVQAKVLIGLIGFFEIPWTPLSPARLLCPWGFSRQEGWSGLPWPPPGDLPTPGIKPASPVLQADPSPPEPPAQPG